MKKLIKEFREFILRGNVMDLAVGVMIGAAFQGIVTSLTDNILSPIIGLFTRQNFDSLELEVLGVTIRYGAFLTSVIHFVILATVIFFLIKFMGRLAAIGKHEDPPAAPPAPATKPCPYCLSEIASAATRCPACTSPLEG